MTPTTQLPKRIPVAAPVLCGREKEYVAECLDEGWISSTGKFVARFEKEFAAFCGVKQAVSCCNGTVAIHLALLAAGVKPGDEVIVPTLTFVATANAVLYCGARPVLVDCDPVTWNATPDAIEAAITPKTRAVVAVHLYGLPCDMAGIASVCSRHGLMLVEDAAESFGGQQSGRMTGSLGDIGTFSFYGNKTISTGEGGMVTTSDSDLAAYIRQLRGQGMDPARRYWFPMLGYNYRMTNVAAAIGTAQLEMAEWHLSRRREVVGWYNSRLDRVPGLLRQHEAPPYRHGHWIHTVILDPALHAPRELVMSRLAADGIETRPVFVPMHELPHLAAYGGASKFPTADRLSAHGFNLPTWGGLDEADVDHICDKLKAALLR